jgi:hypothetical protein
VWYFGTVPTVWYFGTVPTVWYFGTVPTVWYSRTVPTVWYFGTVPTVWYFLELFRQCGICLFACLIVVICFILYCVYTMDSYQRARPVDSFKQINFNAGVYPDLVTVQTRLYQDSSTYSGWVSDGQGMFKFLVVLKLKIIRKYKANVNVNNKIILNTVRAYL